jgi:hypothetical protein
MQQQLCQVAHLDLHVNLAISKALDLDLAQLQSKV